MLNPGRLAIPASFAITDWTKFAVPYRKHHPGAARLGQVSPNL